MEASRPDKKYKDSYWYMHEHEECVLCGHRREIKYRVHDKPKPNDPGKRHKFSQFVCGEHFA